MISVLLIVQWGWEKYRPPDFFAQVGSYDGITDGNVLYGWARLKEQPGKQVEVGFYEGDKLVATALADQDVPEVTEQSPFLARHGFLCPVPDSLRDGKPHVIRARIVGTSCLLSNTPAIIHLDPK
jgi:hypothetical protein